MQFEITIHVSTTQCRISIYSCTDRAFIPCFIRQVQIRSQQRPRSISQFVISRSMHSQTYTKRRILNRPEDGTEFEVETRTVYTVKALQRVAFLINLPVALPFVGIHFIIERIFVVIHIVSTQSNTEIKTVIYIEGDIEIILVNTTTLTRQEISIRFGRNIRGIEVRRSRLTIHRKKRALIPHSS